MITGVSSIYKSHKITRVLIYTLTKTECPEVLHNVRNADWWPSLRNPIFDEILTTSIGCDELNADAAPIAEESFALGIALLQAFVQENFLGPHLDDNTYAKLPHQIHDLIDVVALLRIDGEDINVNTRRPELLLVSKAIFEHLLANTDATTFDASDTNLLRWWYIRLLYVHQQIIDEHTSTLFTAFELHANALLASDNVWLTDPELCALLRLEIAQGYLAYRRAWRADEHMDEARSALTVKVDVEGFLGKRTKWQETALPQLALRVDYGDVVSQSAAVTHALNELPCLLSLDDEVRLERVTFEREEDNRTLELPAIVQQFVLGKL